MPYSEQTRTTARRARSTLAVAVALAIAAAIGAVLGYQAVPGSSSSTASPVVTVPGDGLSSHGDDPQGLGRGVPDHPGPPGGTDSVVPDGVGVEDGVVHGAVTVFDGDVPAVANLDPDLLSALRQAARAAAGGGVQFSVNSGWRSREYQDRLLREAVSEYGSEEEAARWVATTDTSPHVSGDGVDIGPADATAWLSEHGARFGLCQIYGNEPWHYELRPQAIDDGCPPMYADPTHDPRMQK